LGYKKREILKAKERKSFTKKEEERRKV